MDIVKYHIHILYIGLGIEEAHHTYSKDVHTYTADELGRAHKNLVIGRKSKKTIVSKNGAYSEGTYTNVSQSYVSL